MAQPTITRRSLLASAPAAAILASASCKPSPALAAAGTSGLDHAIAAYHQAAARDAAYDLDVYQPVVEALRAAEAAVPHYTTKARYKANAGFRHMSTANDTDVAVAKTLGELPPSAKTSDFRICAEELREAIERREREIERLHADSRIDEIVAESNRLNELSGDALWEVESFPVQTLSDLIRKVAFLDERGAEPMTPEMLLGDLRRIEGRA